MASQIPAGTPSEKLVDNDRNGGRVVEVHIVNPCDSDGPGMSAGVVTVPGGEHGSIYTAH